MSFDFRDCFLCSGKGKLNIGENLPFIKTKTITCPCCKGRGKLIIKPPRDINNPRKKRKDWWPFS